MDHLGISDKIGDAWYFYASPSHEYYCRLDPEGKVPAMFHGPFESKLEAIAEYNAWKQDKMETEADEYEPE